MYPPTVRAQEKEEVPPSSVLTGSTPNSRASGTTPRFSIKIVHMSLMAEGSQFGSHYRTIATNRTSTLTMSELISIRSGRRAWHINPRPRRIVSPRIVMRSRIPDPPLSDRARSLHQRDRLRSRTRKGRARSPPQQGRIRSLCRKGRVRSPRRTDRVHSLPSVMGPTHLRARAHYPSVCHLALSRNVRPYPRSGQAPMCTISQYIHHPYRRQQSRALRNRRNTTTTSRRSRYSSRDWAAAIRRQCM